MSDVRFFVLGPPRIERDGQAVHIERHRALALLAYLAVTGEHHRRDALAALFWPEYDQTRARAALRRTLSALNTTLGEDVLLADREHIGLRDDGDAAPWADVAQFRLLLSTCRRHGHAETEVCADCLPALAQAAALYRGDFLAGFTLRDSADFDDWQVFQAEILRRELTGVLERLTREYSIRREFEIAIGYARRWVALDPLHEPAQRVLISLYAWAGQRQTALRQYAECARVLERELGAPPQTATTQLYTAIKENRPPPLPETPAPARPGAEPAASAPALLAPQQPSTHTFPMLDRMVRGQLVGRERESERIAAIWQRVSAGQGCALLVSGEAGIGKTRLGREVVALATNVGASVWVGRCDAERAAPYTPIAQWIAGVLGEADEAMRTTPGYILADLLSLAPQLRPRFPQITPNPMLDPDLERQRLFDSFVAWCRRLAAQTPLLLWIEDIHWADSGTLSLLRYLAQQMQNLRLLLLLTYRDDELGLAESRGLGELLAELDRERITDTIRLTRLSRDQTRRLLATLLATPDEISAEFLDSVYGETEGNPFFIEEVCKTLIEEGKLYFTGGSWRRADIKSVLIPRSIRAAILGRVERLPVAHQELLRSAAVLGREFDVATLRALSGWDEETLLDLLEQIERTQLIAEAQRKAPVHYTFVHALIPFTLRENLSGLRLQRLHGRAAAALEALHPNDFEALAYHFTAAGERSKAIVYCRQAAQRARSLYTYDAAVQHLHTALNLLEDEASSGERLSILEQLADLHRLAGERGEAMQLYADALDLWRSQVDGERWSGVRLCRKIGETHLHLESSVQMERFAASAQASQQLGLALIADAPPHPEAVRLLATLADDARGVQRGQDWAVAERYAQAAVAMAEQLDAPAELAVALAALETVYGVRGRLRERVSLALAGVALSRNPACGNKQEQCRLLTEAGNALLLVGDYAQALVYLAEAEMLADYMRDVTRQVWVLGLQAQCFFGLDRWDEMSQIEDKRQALEDRYGHHRVGIMCFYCGLRANVAALRGDYAAARHFRQIAFDNMVNFWDGPPESGKWPGAGHY